MISFSLLDVECFAGRRPAFHGSARLPGWYTAAMSTSPPDRRVSVWPWLVAAAAVGLLVWNLTAFNRGTGRYTAEFTLLLNAGTAPGDEWLTLARTDPAAAHAIGSADFRRQVPADRLAAVLRANPALTDPATALTFRSAGGGRVTGNLFGGGSYDPPRLVLAGPDGLVLEFVPEDGRPALDALLKDGANLLAGP